MANKGYTSKDIQVLTDKEHVRKRLAVYAGNTTLTEYTVPIFKDGMLHQTKLSFIPAVYKCINEIIDNSIDEFAQITQTDKTLDIKADPINGMYTIADNGRGVPIDKHESGKHTPEVVFGSLRAGRNFSDDKEAGVIGMNGMGCAITNYCCSDFKITITRDKKKYVQTFTDGAENVTKPSIRKSATTKTGTELTFNLDPSVFSDVSIPAELMRNRAIELALTNPGINVSYNGEKFKYKTGFQRIIKEMTMQQGSFFKFEAEVPAGTLEFYVVFGVHEGIDEQVFTWVNSSYLFDGGICNTQFMNAFTNAVLDQLKAQAKKTKSEVTKNDVRKNLLVIGNLKVKDPQYDAQSKTRLTGPNLRKEITDMVNDMWSSFARKNKDWLAEVLERAVMRHHATENKKAVKEHKKALNKKVPGLLDARDKVRFNCKLLVTEGDSAASMISDVRCPNTIASLPLGGKINNVYGTTTAQLLKMGKITDLLTAIGLVPGQKAVRSELRYGQVIIATDADPDGGDIFTLLVNLFYQFWPELFDPNYEPFIYRLLAPNVVATKGKNRVHFVTRADYNSKKGRYKGYSIEYMKGLGSMKRADWRMILRGETDTSIPITDDGNLKETLTLLFGPDTQARKEWLQAS